MARSRVHGIVVACARLAALALAAALLAPSPAGAFETHYRVVDLGGVMAGSGAFALSRDGSAVGFEMFGPSLPHAVLFEHGEVIDLGTLGGNASLANAVGSGGRVVGWARLPDSTRHAFLSANGVMQDLGTLGGHTSQAFDINESGTVVGGSWDTGDHTEFPFAWSPDSGMRLLQLPGSVGGQALAVNDAGAITGYFVDGVETQPFVWTRDSARVLPSLGGKGAKAYGISPGGRVAGYALTPGVQPYFHAVMWDAAGIHDLGTLAGGHSVAYDLNDAGVVVGFSYTAALQMVAVVFGEHDIYDLNLSAPPGDHWQLAMATAVDADGVITGLGWLDGVQRAFALVPTRLQSPPWGTPSLYARVGVRAYPLPMSDAGTVELDLPAATRGQVALYDVSGRRVAELARGEFTRGRVYLDVPAAVLHALGAGVFYARLESEMGGASQRIVVVR